MEKKSKKQEILESALDLFSTYGFEATSISQIADAVGIKKASLYNHFESKQAILDTLIRDVFAAYQEKSIFAEKNVDGAIEKLPNDVDGIVQILLGQIKYILRDPAVSRGRKMLTIEQFRNPMLAQLRTKQSYTGILNLFTKLVERSIETGLLKDMEPQLMASQLCLPISVWIELCDREPEREGEVLSLVERHIRQFFVIYGK